MDLLPFLFIAGTIMIVTHYLTISIGNIYLLFASKIIIACILYISAMWISGANTFRESLQYLKKNKK